jgi:deoxyribose-phosphate aldolase
MIATEQAIKNGAKTIDILCPSVPLCNRKYDRFREDIKTIKDICLQNNVDLRYFLEYRIYSYELLYKMAQILCDFGVTTAFPSTGYFLDDIHDNILATALINKKNSNINIIVNGNIWNKKHLDMIKKANLYGIRVNSLNGLKLLTDQNN